LSGEIEAADGTRARVRLASGEVVEVAVDASQAKAGQSVTLGIRPEHLQAHATSNCLTATVRFVESLGAVSYAYGVLSGGTEELTAQFEPDTPVAAAQFLRLGVPAGAAFLFDTAGRAYPRPAAT
jgi:multiple sugar transport system ATP-binding protein